MELGALVCRPKSPNCNHCPIKSHCQAYANNTQSLYPVKSKGKKQDRLSYYALILENEFGQYFIEQRPENGLLAGLWQFPMVEQKDLDQNLLTSFVEELFQTKVIETAQLKSIKHIFSHVIWSIDVFHLKVDQIELKNNNQRFVDFKQLSQYPFPVPFQKMIQQLQVE